MFTSEIEQSNELLKSIVRLGLGRYPGGMQIGSTLTESEREQGIRALFATLYAHNSATAALALELDEGHSTSAHDRLVEQLKANPEGWATWLADAEHDSAAESMISALNDEDFARFESDEACATLFAVLDAVRMSRATNRALASEYAATESSAHIIDLRDPITASQ
jgi:hypothetical protein